MLKYFVGKAVSVLTPPVARNFQDEAKANGRPDLYPQNTFDYFLGIVEEVNGSFISLRHPVFGTLAVFNLNNIIGVVEEQYIEDQKVIGEIKKKREENTQQRKQLQEVLDHAPRTIKCPGCGVKLAMPDGMEGVDVQCPACSAHVTMKSSNHISVDALTQLAKDAKSKLQV